MASFDPWWMLTQTRVDSAVNLPFQSIPSARNSGTPARHGSPPDLDAQMEAILKAVSREELSIAERSRDARETVRDESGVGDSGDDATRLNDLEVEADEDQVDRVTLARIQRALGRIDDGTYGVSEFSGKPIPKGRLEAVPYATTLVEEVSSEPA